MINSRLKKLTPQFKNILKISSKIAKKSGYNIYLVGGVVRDLLLNRPVFDLDIVVEGDAILFVKRLAGCLGQSFRKHHSFGTATLYHDNHKIDFATARQEKYQHHGALPKVQPSCLEKDLARRDFSINAMAISLNKESYGQLIDFYGGRRDLKNGLIRILYPESFLDDSLRILRALRFEQRFSFRIEAKTFLLMEKAIKSGALKFVHSHRLRNELILFLNEPKPYKYIKRLYSLENLNFIDESIKLNKKDFRFFIRAESALKFYKKKFKENNEIKSWLVYLAGILLHLSDEKYLEVVNRFGFRKDQRDTISSIKKNLGKIRKLDYKKKNSEIYKILKNYSPEALVFFYAYFPKKNLRKNIRLFLEVLSQQKLKVKGKDLKKIGIQSSSFMGEILKELFYRKLDKGLEAKGEELREAKEVIQNKQSLKR
ncbi:MAG: CCA tRNA nucleotidyltransferase [Candidatus Omnitrophica bacterium]|nr:CCA tRNA nucleotidyltransferase [Candidatus Omnitrophota bacterium]MCF7877506.1 CCA tRNA nucleotidyltransferase [Candidatus Omnitrophota bacterium]MCF7877867.1 CCA tRNA nucleotidyltransferase [Candidatus Omnitrophota bacterium]MCF7892559.1 CCA tRNA nucleotidyltransferase [Candidatus Omnitrophota bacterium]